MSWQIAGVVLIEVLALAFLVYKLAPRRRPKVLQKPDVKVADLLRKRKSD
jgi:hypothetical protein